MNTRRWDGKPESAGDRRSFDLRDSGYQGPIDQDNYPADEDAPLRDLRAAVKVDQEMADASRRFRIQQIRDRLAAASDGPWHAVDLRHQRGGQIRIFPRRGLIVANVLRSGDNAGADAELIANAPADLAWLLDQLDQLRSKSAKRSESDPAFCGWCDHHADRHDYFAGPPIPCADCPDGVCHREAGGSRG